MRKTLILFFCMFVSSGMANDLDDAKALYNVARDACSGIAAELAHVSTVSTVNTVVGGVGAASSGGALAVGVAKNKVDAEIEQLVREMCETGGCDANTIEQMSGADLLTGVIGPMAKIAALVEEKTEQSKKMGDWRTGLMSGTVATNVVNAIVGGINRNQSELIQRIQGCNATVAQLAQYKTRLVAMGFSPLEYPIVNDIDSVVTWCRPIDINDVEKIEKRMTAIMGTGIAGAAIGVAGTVTSGAANSDRVRNDNTDAGKHKEQELNTAANVMAGANVVTGATEMGLGISLVTLSKKLIEQAELCRGAFK